MDELMECLHPVVVDGSLKPLTEMKMIAERNKMERGGGML
jgi:hypothetical protein